MLKYRPNEIKLITQLCYSAVHSEQYSKATGYCETVYAKNPDTNIFKILVNAYKESGDKVKYGEMSRKAVDLLEPAQALSTSRNSWHPLPRKGTGLRLPVMPGRHWICSPRWNGLPMFPNRNGIAGSARSELTLTCCWDGILTRARTGPALWSTIRESSETLETKTQRRSPLLHRDVELEGKPSPAGHGSLCLRGGSERFSSRSRVRQALDPPLQVHPQRVDWPASENSKKRVKGDCS